MITDKDFPMQILFNTFWGISNIFNSLIQYYVFNYFDKQIMFPEILNNYLIKKERQIFKLIKYNFVIYDSEFLDIQVCTIR